MAVNRLTRWRVPLGFLFAAWYGVLLWNAQPAHLGIATVIIVAGCALRSWAAGYLFKGKRVAVGGPYAYVRNPLYLGSFIIGVGFYLVLLEPVTPMVALYGFAFVAGFVVLYFIKSRGEEAELVQSLGQAYELYRSKVPLFLPIRGKVSGLGEQHFSMELYRKNREYQCILGSIAILALLFCKARYGY